MSEMECVGCHKPIRDSFIRQEYVFYRHCGDHDEREVTSVVIAHDEGCLADYLESRIERP